MEKQKNDFWQIVRGVCILAVILIHCPSGGSYGSIETSVWLILRQFINFPVAIFFFMSGYFTNIQKCLQNPGKYILIRGGVSPINTLLCLERGI